MLDILVGTNLQFPYGDKGMITLQPTENSALSGGSKIFAGVPLPNGPKHCSLCIVLFVKCFSCACMFRMKLV